MSSLLPLDSQGHLHLLSYYTGYVFPSENFLIYYQLILVIVLFVYFSKDIVLIFTDSVKAIFMFFFKSQKPMSVFIYKPNLSLLIFYIFVFIANFFVNYFFINLNVSIFFICLMLLISSLFIFWPYNFVFVRDKDKIIGLSSWFFLFLGSIFNFIPGLSSVAIMLGLVKFFGINRDYGVKIVLISLIPITLPNILLNINVLYNNIIYSWLVLPLLFVCFLFLAFARYLLKTRAFYRFSIYLLAISIWTILDFFYGVTQ